MVNYITDHFRITVHIKVDNSEAGTYPSPFLMLATVHRNNLLFRTLDLFTFLLSYDFFLGAKSEEFLLEDIYQ